MAGRAAHHRAPRSPLRARHVPVVHAERGREDHGVHGYRPRPRGSRAEHGARACRRSLRPCTRLTVRGSRAQPQTTTGTYGTSARRGPGGCGWAVWPMAIARAREDPAPSPQHAHARHHIASHAGRHVVPRSWGPAGDAELYGYLVERAAASPPGSRTARRRQPCDRERAMRGGAAERTRDVPVRRGGTTARARASAQGEHVAHAPVRRGARGARGRELSFLEFCPPFW